MSIPSAPKFQVAVGKASGVFLGPSWETEAARRSLHRINGAATAEEAVAQGVAEGVMVLHSIRRILIWTAVIVPSLVAAVAIVLMVASAESASCTSIYSC